MSEEYTAIHVPEDEKEVIELAEAESEREKNVAIAQAEIIGDL